MSKYDVIKLLLLHINHSYHELKLTRESITSTQLHNLVVNLISDLEEDLNKIDSLDPVNNKKHDSALEQFYD